VGHNSVCSEVKETLEVYFSAPIRASFLHQVKCVLRDAELFWLDNVSIVKNLGHFWGSQLEFSLFNRKVSISSEHIEEHLLYIKLTESHGICMSSKVLRTILVEVPVLLILALSRRFGLLLNLLLQFLHRLDPLHGILSMFYFVCKFYIQLNLLVFLLLTDLLLNFKVKFKFSLVLLLLCFLLSGFLKISLFFWALTEVFHNTACASKTTFLVGLTWLGRSLSIIGWVSAVTWFSKLSLSGRSLGSHSLTDVYYAMRYSLS
jgi:hypothetical protein